jgi:VWFA-related protein
VRVDEVARLSRARWREWAGGTRRMLPRTAVALTLPLAFGSVPRPLEAQQPHRLGGVEISRVVLEARALDGGGHAIPGLGPRDFTVKVDGRVVPLDAAVWIPGGMDQSDAPSPSDLPLEIMAGSGEPGEIPGRLIVLLFQKDHRGSRLHGLLRMITHSAELLDQFGPRDRVAVVVFDGQLRVHLDFTGQRGLLERALSHSILNAWPEPLPPGPPPSLAAAMEPCRARLASTPEKALLLLAETLEAWSGVKLLLVFGWGVGQTVGGVVTLSADYDRARQVLNRSGTNVFAVDIVDADYHTLESTLEKVSTDTGGLCVRTSHHPGVALSQLAEALSGHYVLSFERPEGPLGEHEVEVRLAQRKGRVLTRSSYID